MIMNVYQDDTNGEPLMAVDTWATAQVGVVKMYYSPNAEQPYAWCGAFANRFIAAQTAHSINDVDGCGLIVTLKPKYETSQPGDTTCHPGDDCCYDCCPRTGDHNHPELEGENDYVD